MAGEEHQLSLSSSTIVDSVPSPQDLDASETPCQDFPDIPLPISGEDRDQEHRENHDHGHDQEVKTHVLTDDLKHRIIKQVEYYFSDENLPTDKHLMGLIKKNKEGFVPIGVIAAFRRMKKLTQDHSFITAALRESSVLVVSHNGKKVKRLHPISSPDTRDPKLFTILVENLPEDHSEENIRRIFGEAGSIRSITICDPNVVEKLGKNNKADVLISNKLHALVEYETFEAAEKAVATLNDEQDWRNGMRVKLKNPRKHSQRKQHWRAADSEKNSSGRAFDQVGDVDARNVSEHHDHVPDEEDGDHQAKDKHGHKGRDQGRDQGRTRRTKYKGVNGMGHGTTSSSAHTVEPSKPPPGPKMPDGTRGFTMGRGRLPTSI